MSEATTISRIVEEEEAIQAHVDKFLLSSVFAALLRFFSQISFLSID